MDQIERQVPMVEKRGSDIAIEDEVANSCRARDDGAVRKMAPTKFRTGARRRAKVMATGGLLKS